VSGIQHESVFSDWMPDTAVPGRLRTAETSPFRAKECGPSCVHLCDLWAIWVGGRPS